jgi:hypothetical protein
MGKTISYGINRPTKKDVDWFSANVSPCTHDLFRILVEKVGNLLWREMIVIQPIPRWIENGSY